MIKQRATSYTHTHTYTHIHIHVCTGILTVWTGANLRQQPAPRAPSPLLALCTETRSLCTLVFGVVHAPPSPPTSPTHASKRNSGFGCVPNVHTPVMIAFTHAFHAPRRDIWRICRFRGRRYVGGSGTKGRRDREGGGCRV